MQKLNKTYRNIDRVTDVLSFAFNDVQDNFIPELLGEIYIAKDQALRQSEELGHSLKDEILFLGVHGLLHLLGYNHEKEEEEKVMFSIQEKELEKWLKRN